MSEGFFSRGFRGRRRHRTPISHPDSTWSMDFRCSLPDPSPARVKTERFGSTGG
jgi:hypothetical protein